MGGFIIMIIGLVITGIGLIMSSSSGGQRDGRFKTGYKNNRLPTPPSAASKKIGDVLWVLGGFMMVIGFILWTIITWK
mgnify:CR=1 FL=1